MGFGDAGDDDDVNVFVGEGLVDAAVGLGARVVLLGIVSGLRGALDDAMELIEVGQGENEGNVEDFGAGSC